jgi:DNA-binding response OmpR family regulator
MLGRAPLVIPNRHYNCHSMARLPMSISTTPRLLIVDDDDSTTRTFARILTLEGFDVRTATTAESGLREIETGHPDAVILDLRMPFINGLGLLYRLRACEPSRRTPVVVVTGDQCLEDSVINELRDLGAEVRFKPLWIEDLVDVARSLIEPLRQLN